jgi:hypothetical protein
MADENPNVAELPPLVYSRVWTSIEDFPSITFTRNWESSSDFPTIDVDEESVRYDMQYLFDEIARYINGTLKQFIAEFGGQFVSFDGLTPEQMQEIQGPQGVTFTPHVDGDILSFTNNGGLPNPDPVRLGNPTETIIVQELNRKYGLSADLTVDNLRTDYRRAQRYLNQDTSNLNYLYIHDEEIEFRTAETDGTETEQLTVDGNAYYWTDSTHTEMTTEITEHPVIVYTYTEDVKAKFYFSEVQQGEHFVKVPVLRLGAGDDLGNNYAELFKDPDGLRIQYKDQQGNFIGLRCGKGGYVDIKGLRKPVSLDFSRWDDGTFTETVDGGAVNSFRIDFDASDRPVKFTDPVGHETAVVW